MTIVGQALYTVLLVFLLLLIFRLVMEYVFMFARSYRPAGVVAMALEVCYSATDPPLHALRRILPPLRIGQVSIDLGFIVLFIVVTILMQIASGL